MGNVLSGKCLSEKRLVRESDCPGKVLSGKRLVRGTSCPGNVLSGERLVRETSVRESDCPGNVCKAPVAVAGAVYTMLAGHLSRSLPLTPHHNALVNRHCRC